MKGLFKILVILLCFSSILCKTSSRRRGRSKREKVVVPEVKEDSFAENGHPSGWVDPHEMVDETPTSNIPTSGECNQDANGMLVKVQEQLSTCQKELQTYKSQDMDTEEQGQPCDLPYLKQIVHALLKATSDANPNTEITLNQENRNILRQFLDGKSNVHDITDIIKHNILNKTLTDSLHENYWMLLKEHFSVFDIGNLILVSVLSSLVGAVLLFEMKTHMSIRKQFLCLFFVAFVVSIPWEWCRLYKKEFAEKQSMIRKDMEKHCHTDHELGFAESLTLLWKSAFTFQGDKKCKIYSEALLVDPIWEIPPSLAFTTTVTRLLVEPLELMFDAFGKSFRALFQHLPLQWQPVMFIACTLVIILCLILISGVRISTPFFQIGVGVDPAVANASLQRLEQQMQEVRGQIADAANRNAQPAIEEVPPGIDADVMPAINNLVNMVNAINERTQQQEEILQRMRAVADQARQAEAIEHPENEQLCENARRAGMRGPVQATDHQPTESN